MGYFLAWLLIPLIFWGAFSVMEWCDDALSNSLGMAISFCVLMGGIVLVVAVAAWPFYMNSDAKNDRLTLDSSVWQCSQSETVIEPVHRLVGKVIVTTNEPVTECLSYQRKH